MTENRAAFVLQEWRVTSAVNDAVPDGVGRVLTVNTQLDRPNAQALADKILAANEQPVTFEQEVEGLILPDAFVGGCPSYNPDYPKFKTDGRTMKLVAFTCDLETGVSSIRIRG